VSNEKILGNLQTQGSVKKLVCDKGDKRYSTNCVDGKYTNDMTLCGTFYKKIVFSLICLKYCTYVDYKHLWICICLYVDNYLFSLRTYHSTIILFLGIPLFYLTDSWCLMFLILVGTETAF